MTQGYFNGCGVQTCSLTWWNTCPSTFQYTNLRQLESLYAGRYIHFYFNEEVPKKHFSHSVDILNIDEMGQS